MLTKAKSPPSRMRPPVLSMSRISRTHAATTASVLLFFLRSAESSAANGSAKWPITMTIATAPQEPRMRAMYQGISSGRLPDQMIRNCENER